MGGAPRLVPAVSEAGSSVDSPGVDAYAFGLRRVAVRASSFGRASASRLPRARKQEDALTMRLITVAFVRCWKELRDRAFHHPPTTSPSPKMTTLTVDGPPLVRFSSDNLDHHPLPTYRSPSPSPRASSDPHPTFKTGKLQLRGAPSRFGTSHRWWTVTATVDDRGRLLVAGVGRHEWEGERVGNAGAGGWRKSLEVWGVRRSVDVRRSWVADMRKSWSSEKRPTITPSTATAIYRILTITPDETTTPHSLLLTVLPDEADEDAQTHPHRSPPTTITLRLRPRKRSKLPAWRSALEASAQGARARLAEERIAASAAEAAAARAEVGRLRRERSEMERRVWRAEMGNSAGGWRDMGAVRGSEIEAGREVGVEELQARVGVAEQENATLRRELDLSQETLGEHATLLLRHETVPLENLRNPSNIAHSTVFPSQELCKKHRELQLSYLILKAQYEKELTGHKRLAALFRKQASEAIEDFPSTATISFRSESVRSCTES
ncbi:hypothetical protein BDK51DRAFT_40171 [Blyttiomyces helicus]|uniref:Uncharacterized protein n=1 Tax=Blyttiomyces helicus TaxID=388810 RepID=A0A4P9WCM8_9FUNG|nr:hypothetical protein BDK51DRAFT_40171 [Blyttiomyces helicus]|eukprot:RKO90082.1 hypothetical protein BDK51DRAFT_40171 [Blyttiomyces helicus]